MSDIGVHIERDIEVLEQREIITHTPTQTRHRSSLEFLIRIVIFVVHIFIQQMNVTRLLTVFGSFFTFFFLPDSHYLVIPDFINIVSDETLVLDIVRFTLADNVTVRIFHIFHDSVQVSYLVLVISQAERSTPCKLIHSDVGRVQ